jgi:hypothetical protein
MSVICYTVPVPSYGTVSFLILKNVKIWFIPVGYRNFLNVKKWNCGKSMRICLRLCSLLEAYPRPLFSHVLEGVTRNKDQFRNGPGAEARAWARYASFYPYQNSFTYGLGQ